MGFFTADLCDNFSEKTEALGPDFKSYGGSKKFKGRVITVKLDKNNKDLAKLLKEESGIGKVVVVDVEKEFFGVVGDKLSAYACKNNYEAIIINGYVRDTKETKKFPLGLFAVGTCPLRNFEKTQASRGLNLEFGGVRFKEDDYIYADEGYGHTIIEDLKVLSQQMSMGPKKTPRDVETAKIKDRLISFNFSSKVELRNPLDGTPIKKSGKEFLVEFTIRVLEQGMLCMPSEEEHLRRQMLNYVVLKRSPTTNKPVYGAESDRVGDHRLDALMLALGGVQLENGLYSDASLARSTPSLMSKDFLDDRAAQRESRDEGPAGKLLSSIKRQQTSFPGAIELLQALRPGETPAEAAARRESGSEARVGRRSRGRMGNEQQSVREWLNSRAKDYRGYADDTEHLYESESVSSHVVGPKRRRKRSGKIKRRR